MASTMLLPDIPPDFDKSNSDYICIDSCYFKIGRFGWLFRWVNGEWRRTNNDRKSLETFRKWPSAEVKVVKWK